MALASILTAKFDEAILIDELEDGAMVIERVQNSVYDLVIMDIQMPNTETLQLINYVHINHPSIPILIYSMTPENVYAVRVMKAGAKGFVSKGSSTEDLKNAIDLVMGGKAYVSQRLAELLSHEQFNIPINPFASLSPRELQIASLLLAGKTVTGICTILNLKNSTVATHKAKVFEKLKVANLLELKEVSNAYQF